MPLLYLSVSALAIYGLFQLPVWLREITIAFAGFFILIVSVGFVCGLLTKVTSVLFKTEVDETTKPHANHDSKVTTSKREPSNGNVVELMRQADVEAALIEDEFLH